MSRPADSVVRHGVRHLPRVTVDAYNAEIRDGDGFVGDRACTAAFHGMLDGWRAKLRSAGDDPLGTKPTAAFKKKKLDKLLREGAPEAAGVIQGAIEDFANELARVVDRFRKAKPWRETRRIVVGGGFRASRVGELAIGRASVLVKAHGHDVELCPIRHDPDQAGLLGAIHLAPPWVFAGHRAILAIDVGGSNVRAGVVVLHRKRNGALPRGTADEVDAWAYADEGRKLSRRDVVERIGAMLRRLVRRATKRGVALAPFVGVACPGVIAEDGTITRGGQNLPGNWEADGFNLPAELRRELRAIGGDEALVVVHNDAVVQGLSELPFMQDVPHWGVLTIGTGLGNATFTNGAERA